MHFAMSQTRQLYWWVWTLLMALAVSATQHIGIVALHILLVLWAVKRVAVLHRYSLKLLIGLIGLLLLMRVMFQMFFGVPVGNHVLFKLPELELFSIGLRVGGIFTLESLQTAMSEALTLGGIIIALLASSMMIPVSTLLRRIPSGFSNISLVLSIALSFLPLFMKDVKRNLRANRWRGHSQRKLTVLAMNVMVIVENALEKSIRLSASMWRRGLGSDQRPSKFDSLRMFGTLLFLAAVGLSLLFAFHTTLVCLMIIGLSCILHSYRVDIANIRLKRRMNGSIIALASVALSVVGIWLTSQTNVEIILTVAIALISITLLPRKEVNTFYAEHSIA